MPHLVRFLLRHALVGFAVSAAFVTALVLLDVARLGTLLSTSADGPFALGLLVFALGLTFASVQMGFAVMLLPSEGDGAGGLGQRLRRLELRPVPVAATMGPGNRSRPVLEDHA